MEGVNAILKGLMVAKKLFSAETGGRRDDEEFLWAVQALILQHIYYNLPVSPYSRLYQFYADKDILRKLYTAGVEQPDNRGHKKGGREILLDLSDDDCHF
jgi:hypothetical protein